MEVRRIHLPAPEVPPSTHLIFEGWKLDSTITQSPRGMVEAMHRYLKQVGLKPFEEELSFDFGQTAASVVVVAQKGESIDGYVSGHSWPEHDNYINVVVKTDHVAPAEAKSAFEEAFQPGEIICDRPREKLAHRIGRLVLPHANYYTPGSAFGLHGTHELFVDQLGLTRFGQEVWLANSKERKVVSGIGLTESHSIWQARNLDDYHSLLEVDLFACTGDARLLPAADILRQLFRLEQLPLLKPVNYEEREQEHQGLHIIQKGALMRSI